MMTDERIRYFLKKDIIPDDEYKALVKHYFQADKTDWYQQNEAGTQWGKVKVQQFWRLIRKHHMPFCKRNKLYYFRKFVFPLFETTINPHNYDEIVQNGDFWEQDEERVFIYAADFRGARFLSNAMFLETVFQKYVTLSYAIFSENANFQMCVFTKETWMKKTSFEEGANFVKAQFKVSTFIKQSEFLQTTTFNYADFEGRLTIDQVLFDSKAMFQRTRFNQAIFTDLMGVPELDFSNTILPDSLIFRRVNLSNTDFIQADISKAQFKESHWGNASRIKLKGEEEHRKTAEDCAKYEELYRQLKKNFDSDKNWELSGKAYMSEMELRKYRLYRNGKYPQWCIYWIYSTFAGYTHHFLKPLMSLIGTIVIFSLWYLWIECNLLNAFQRGLYGALPKLFTVAVPVKKMFPGNWLIVSNIEGILGVTFLTFFILALRKRFR